MTVSLRSQIAAVEAAKASANTPAQRAMQADHIRAAGKTLRWLMKHETLLRSRCPEMFQAGAGR